MTIIASGWIIVYDKCKLKIYLDRCKEPCILYTLLMGPILAHDIYCHTERLLHWIAQGDANAMGYSEIAYNRPISLAAAVDYL